MNTLDVRVRNMIIAVLAVLAFFLLVQSVSVIAAMKKGDGMMPSKVISVRGMGEAVATPDIATFSFTVRETGKDVATVQQAMTDKANKAIDYVKQQGVAEKDIKVESYYTNPTYQYANSVCTEFSCPPSQQILTGYEVSETVSVKVRDVAKAGDMLTGIAALQVGEVSSLSFTVDDMDTLKLEAKKQAIEKARAEAEEIADSLGVDLAGVVSFYEDYPYEPAYGYEGDMSVSAVKMQDAAIAPPLPTGEQKVTANVSVTYEIED